MVVKNQADVKFYDTCSLLLGGESIFDSNQKFLISSITLKELENIKTSSNKDADVKYNARLLLHLLDKNVDKYITIAHKTAYEQSIINAGFEINNDTKILSDAVICNNGEFKDRIIFVTNDLSLKTIANLFFGNKNIESIEEDKDNYTGYKIIKCDDDILANFYQDSSKNIFELLTNEYVILKNSNEEIVDVQVWTGDCYRNIKYSDFESSYFGKINPYQKDIYQKMLFDSLMNNQITMVKGPPGSGKTIISLAFLMSQLEKGKLNKVVIFCNTVATANAARLGFYAGSRTEKLLDSQIGNLLISKFGGQYIIDKLIANEELVLLPCSDIRGYDTTGMKAGIYISEAQNLDRTLIKLALTRVGQDSACIIDGDIKTQVDDIHFEGHNNGMRRVSKIYRGHDIYGEVTLKNVYRSEIAKLAQLI